MTEDKIKVIYIEYNGFEWWFPAIYVARNWAEYYSKKMGTKYEDECTSVMEDTSALVSWFLSYMNWSDVSKYARISKQPFEVSPDLTESEIRVDYR